MSAGIIRVGVEAVELRGPGLPDWRASQPVLTGAEMYRPAPMTMDAPSCLSAAERRRAIPSVKLALGVATACVAQSGLDPASLPAVFASSGADGQTIVAILSALTTPDREVSPTRFHNSVHNAPSGYWGIAVQSRQPVSSVSCYDASFAAGLLEAGVQAVAGDQAVLLAAYDLPYPNPLDGIRPIDVPFGVALVLRPMPSRRALAELCIKVIDGAGATGCADQGLEALRRGNPTAWSLPLLVSLARRSAGKVRLELSQGALDVDVVPC